MRKDRTEDIVISFLGAGVALGLATKYTPAAFEQAGTRYFGNYYGPIIATILFGWLLFLSFSLLFRIWTKLTRKNK